jgi:hypothetical protein
MFIPIVYIFYASVSVKLLLVELYYFAAAFIIQV